MHGTLLTWETSLRSKNCSTALTLEIRTVSGRLALRGLGLERTVAMLLQSLGAVRMPGGNLIHKSSNSISKVGPDHLHPSRCDSELGMELHCFCGITPSSNFFFN